MTSIPARYGISKSKSHSCISSYCFKYKEEGSDADAWIEEGNQRNDQVALEHPLAPLTYQQEAQALITEMMDFAQALELPHPPFLDQLSEMLAEPERTFAGRLFSASQATSQAQTATVLGQKYHQAAWEKPYQLAGFRAMELSTQILLFDAIQKESK